MDGEMSSRSGYWRKGWLTGAKGEGVGACRQERMIGSRMGGLRQGWMDDVKGRWPGVKGGWLALRVSGWSQG